MSNLALNEQPSQPSTPASAKVKLYSDNTANPQLLFIDDGALVTPLLDQRNTTTAILNKTFTNPSTTAGTASVPSMTVNGGTLLTNAIAGGIENDAIGLYGTTNTSDGRGHIQVRQHFRLTANGGNVTTIANFFGTTSNISLVANAYYEIEIWCFFTKTTTEILTWTFTNSSAPTSQQIYWEQSPITGIVAPPGTATNLVGQFINDATAARTVAAGSLTTAVNHFMHCKIFLKNGTGTSLKIQCANPAGSVTPLLGSQWTSVRIPTANTGTFAA